MTWPVLQLHVHGTVQRGAQHGPLRSWSDVLRLQTSPGCMPVSAKGWWCSVGRCPWCRLPFKHSVVGPQPVEPNRQSGRGRRRRPPPVQGSSATILPTSSSRRMGCGDKAIDESRRVNRKAARLLLPDRGAIRNPGAKWRRPIQKVGGLKQVINHHLDAWDCLSCNGCPFATCISSPRPPRPTRILLPDMLQGH